MNAATVALHCWLRGKKRTGGRKKGSYNKGTVHVKALSQQYTVEALAGLVEIARDVLAPHAVRLTAWNSILDRGHGKPAQLLPDGNTGMQGIITVRWLDMDDGESKPITIDHGATKAWRE